MIPEFSGVDSPEVAVDIGEAVLALQPVEGAGVDPGGALCTHPGGLLGGYPQVGAHELVYTRHHSTLDPGGAGVQGVVHVHKNMLYHSGSPIKVLKLRHTCTASSSGKVPRRAAMQS